MSSYFEGDGALIMQVRDILRRSRHKAAAIVSANPWGSSTHTHTDHDAVPFNPRNLKGKRVAMVVFSYYTNDPRPRRAAEALAGMGMSVDLVCLRQSAEDPKHEVLNGVNVRRVSLTRQREGVFRYFYQYAVFLLITSGIFAARSLTRRYAMVYVHNMPDFLVLCGLIPKAYGAKLVLDLHDPMPELMRTIFELPEEATSVRLLKFVEKWSIRLANSVVTVNRACAKLFASRSCRPEKITVVMNSPDEEIFRLRHRRTMADNRDGNKPFVIMYHGSLVERNGLDLAVEAFAKVRAVIPNAELRVYGGRNAFLDRVLDSVRKQGLEGVHYLGSKKLEEIVKAIEECDVGIIPNQRNIFTEINTPTRIFEYLALEKPVIAPRVPGICDYFDEGSLIFFELGNARDLARQIEHVFHSPDDAREKLKRGLEVHRAHRWRDERLQLLGLVDELLSDSNGRVHPA
jgi:glycosyltransferase involved in cell wall biosynthesis